MSSADRLAIDGGQPAIPEPLPKGGHVDYSREMCPRTLDILSRAMRLGIGMSLTDTHIRQIAAAINKVDAALA